MKAGLILGYVEVIGLEDAGSAGFDVVYRENSIQSVAYNALGEPMEIINQRIESVQDLLINPDFKVVVVPNPFKSVAQVIIESPEAFTGTITVFNQFGTQIIRHSQVIGKGNNVISIDGASELPAGIYYLEVKGGQFNTTQKMVRN